MVRARSAGYSTTGAPAHRRTFSAVSLRPPPWYLFPVVVILVSNDDGIRAAGIRALEAALTSLGEVWVVAPDREQSAASHSLSLHRPLRVEKLDDRHYALLRAFASEQEREQALSEFYGSEDWQPHAAAVDELVESFHHLVLPAGVLEASG